MSHPGSRIAVAAAALLLAANLEPAPRPGVAPSLACEAQAANGQDHRPLCCFTNPRYAGTCKVEPAEGESCASILEYLNNPQSQGKSYCSSTTLRRGWKQTPCQPQMNQD